MNLKPSNLIELMDLIADSLADERDGCEVMDDLIEVQLHVEQWMMSEGEAIDVCLKLIQNAIEVQYDLSK